MNRKRSRFQDIENGCAIIIWDAAKTNLLKGALIFNGRYPLLGLNGSQFGQLGTTFQGGLFFSF